MNTHELIGSAPEFKAALRQAQVVAMVDVTLLLLGESGTGKELLAHNIHKNSKRANKPFIAINCANLEDNLSGIEKAHLGTLFLDEIGDAPLTLQAKLLRFIENGSNQSRQYDIRIIAATNKNLGQMVKDGLFRADLFYRLNVVPIELPALRKRRGDIKFLLHSLTATLAATHGLNPPLFDLTALNALENYAWPGNVRELRNFCERMVILRPGMLIAMENLPSEVLDSVNQPQGRMSLPENGVDLGTVEVSFIRQALNKTSGNRTKAARLLGITRDTLLYRMKKHAIQ